MRAKLVVLLLGVCLLVNAQPPIQKFWALNQCNLLLAKLPVKPSAAYSLRKLSCTYTGPAIKVRRDADNATQDIGFTSAGNLDVTTLSNFITNTNSTSVNYINSDPINNTTLTITVPNATITGITNITGKMDNDSYNLTPSQTNITSSPKIIFGYTYSTWLTTYTIMVQAVFTITAPNTITIQLQNPRYAYGDQTSDLSKSYNQQTGNPTYRSYSDNFDSNGTYIISSLNLTLSGSFQGSGYVTTWYDQSGNGRNAVQTATSQQPCIVNNGSIYLQNSKPSIYFANDCLNYPGSTNLGNISHSLNCVGNALYSTGSKNPGNGTGNFVALSSTAVGNQNSTLGSGNNSVSGCEGAIWLGGYSQDNGYQFGSALSALAIRTKTYSPSTNPSTYGFVNITTIYSVNVSYNNLNSDIEIGDQDINHDDPLTGYISEIFVFLSSLNDNVRLILESNQKIYYGTP